MKSKVWHRDCHGLFDYEAPQYTVQTSKTASNCNLVRHDNDISLIRDPVTCKLETFAQLASVERVDSKY